PGRGQGDRQPSRWVAPRPWGTTHRDRRPHNRPPTRPRPRRRPPRTSGCWFAACSPVSCCPSTVQPTFTSNEPQRRRQVRHARVRSRRTVAPCRHMDMGDYWSSVLLIAALLLLNAVFAGSEIALISLREGQLRQLERRGGRTARTLVRLARVPNRLPA